MIITLSNSVSAADVNDVVFLEAGRPAPFAGYLFTEAKAKESRQWKLLSDSQTLEISSYKRSIDLQDSSLTLKDQQIDLLVKRNGELLKQSNSDLEKVLYFVGGILTMYLASRMVK